MKLPHSTQKTFAGTLLAQEKAATRGGFATWTRLAVATVSLLAASGAMATPLFWDPSGGPTATGTWGSGNANWNTASNGTGSFTDTTTSADALTFSATPVTSGGVVTVVGTQNAAGITLNTTGLTFNGGTITTAAGSQLLMNSAVSGTINSALSLGNSINFNGSNQTLTLGGGETGGVTVIGGNAAKALTATLQLNGSGATNYQFSSYNIGDVSAGTGGAVLNTGALISYSVANTLGIGNGVAGTTGLLTINGGNLGNGDSNTNVAVGRSGGAGRLILTSGTVSLGVSRVFNIDQGDTTGGSGRVDVNGGAAVTDMYLEEGIFQAGPGKPLVGRAAIAQFYASSGPQWLQTMTAALGQVIKQIPDRTGALTILVDLRNVDGERAVNAVGKSGEPANPIVAVAVEAAEALGAPVARVRVALSLHG